MNFNRETFFSGYRAAFGSLNQSQVEGLDFLLDRLEQDKFTLKHIAYILATVGHESAHTFQPIKERRGRAGTAIRKIQDRYWGTGYYGRGYVQITWEKNYEKFGIADDPDRALEPETAYEIVSRGMAEGLFTGKKLSDFINGKTDYFNARKIVNGLDKADEIASRARKYEGILSKSVEKPSDEEKGITTGSKPADETEGTQPPAPAAEVKASQPSMFTRLGSLSIPAGVMTALGAIGSFVQSLPPWVWVTVIGMALLVAYLIYRDAQQRAHQRTLKVMDAAASKTDNNLRLI